MFVFPFRWSCLLWNFFFSRVFYFSSHSLVSQQPFLIGNWEGERDLYVCSKAHTRVRASTFLISPLQVSLTISPNRKSGSLICDAVIRSFEIHIKLPTWLLQIIPPSRLRISHTAQRCTPDSSWTVILSALHTCMYFIAAPHPATTSGPTRAPTFLGSEPFTILQTTCTHVP